MLKYLLPFLLIGCGGPGYMVGLYAVDVHYVRDDWPGSLVGQTTQAQYRITEEDGKYELHILGTNSTYSGVAVGGQIWFRKVREEKAPSCYAHELSLKLEQETAILISGEGFTITKIDCSGVEYRVDVTVAGHLLEEL